MHTGSHPAKLEDLAGLFIFQVQHEKVYSGDQLLVKVRSCGHILVSAKPVT